MTQQLDRTTATCMHQDLLNAKSDIVAPQTSSCMFTGTQQQRSAANHQHSSFSASTARMAQFSGAVKIGDLNDFIAPSQACVVSLQGQQKQTPSNAAAAAAAKVGAVYQVPCTHPSVKAWCSGLLRVLYVFIR